MYDDQGVDMELEPAAQVRDHEIRALKCGDTIAGLSPVSEVSAND